MAVQANGLRKISFALMAIGVILFFSLDMIFNLPKWSIVGWIIALIGVVIYSYDYIKNFKYRLF